MQCLGFLIAIGVAMTVSPVAAQSGGGFEITEAVVAGGGASASNGGTELDSTFGQPASGDALLGGSFAVTSGFWNYVPLVPTAAAVAISGRVATSSGAAVSNAVLFLQTQDGQIRIARSAAFGYFMFEEVIAGQSVFITVEHKNFVFEPRTVLVSDNVTDLDFVGQPQSVNVSQPVLQQDPFFEPPLFKIHSL